MTATILSPIPTATPFSFPGKKIVVVGRTGQNELWWRSQLMRVGAIYTYNVTAKVDLVVAPEQLLYGTNPVKHPKSLQRAKELQLPIWTSQQMGQALAEATACPLEQVDCSSGHPVFDDERLYHFQGRFGKTSFIGLPLLYLIDVPFSLQEQKQYQNNWQQAPCFSHVQQQKMRWGTTEEVTYLVSEAGGVATATDVAIQLQDGDWHGHELNAIVDWMTGKQYPKRMKRRLDATLHLLTRNVRSVHSQHAYDISYGVCAATVAPTPDDLL